MGVRGVFSDIIAPEETRKYEQKRRKKEYFITKMRPRYIRSWLNTLFFEGGERSRFPTIIQTAQIRQRKTN